MDLSSMLESQHQLAGGIVVDRRRVDPGMAGRICGAGQAKRMHIADLAIAGGAGRCAGKLQLAPALGAKTTLLRYRAAAQRAAWRIDEVDNRPHAFKDLR